MARNDPQMNLRVPMELKEKIEKSALDNGRTITAEAVHRLENSFKPETNPRETFEFEAMERIYKEQARELKLLREMVEKIAGTKS